MRPRTSDEARHAPGGHNRRTLLCLDCWASRRIGGGGGFAPRVGRGRGRCHECGGGRTEVLDYRVRVPRRDASERTWRRFLDRFVRGGRGRRRDPVMAFRRRHAAGSPSRYGPHPEQVGR